MKPLHINERGWCEQVQQIASPNFDARPVEADITLMVIHNISLPPNEFGGQWITDLFLNQLDPNAHPYFATIHTFEVSSHFLIRRDGALIQYVSTLDRAWHAGASCWRGVTRCNDFAIGVELEGADGVPFTAAQYDTLCQLSNALRSRHPSINSVAGHSEIAPQRKTDPSGSFEWARFESLAKIPVEWRKQV